MLLVAFLGNVLFTSKFCREFRRDVPPVARRQQIFTHARILGSMRTGSSVTVKMIDGIVVNRPGGVEPIRLA